LKEDNKEEITAEDILEALGPDNVEEKIYQLIGFLTKDRLIELKDTFRKKCKSKCIVPLRQNNTKNIKMIYVINDDKLPRETCNLLNQSYMSLINVRKLIKNKSLVDTNSLLRSAFENLVMGMMIYLDSNVYEEFKQLGLKDEERVFTKQQKLRNLFRKKLKKIDKDTFGDTSNTQNQKLLDEYYNKLCLFTHSTLIVNQMVEATLNQDEDVFILIAKQNMYFLEILLNCCLKFITKDKGVQIKYEYLLIGWYILVSDIDRNKYSDEYLSKYNDLLYLDINKKYIDKEGSDLKSLENEMKKLDKVIKENPVAVIEFLESFLNKEDK